jgi:hypothetical protein
MPNLQTKKAVVNVNLDLNHEPPFYFTSTDLPVGPDNRLTFQYGKKDGFKIDFVLVDPGNTYVFEADKDEALYSTSEAICPCPKGQWDQFMAMAVDNNGNTGPTLTVHNKNKNQQDFGYMLRITDGRNQMNLDPIGTNQNSNSGGSRFLVAAIVFVAGAAVGAAAARFEASLAQAVSLLGAAALGGVVFLGIYLALSGSRQQRLA